MLYTDGSKMDCGVEVDRSRSSALQTEILAIIKSGILLNERIYNRTNSIGQPKHLSRKLSRTN